MSMENSSDTIGNNRTRDLPVCSAMPHPTALPRAPKFNSSGSSKTQFIACIFFAFPLLILRSLSPHSVNTIYSSSSSFLTPSCYWPVGGCPAAAAAVDVFCQCGEVVMYVHIARKVVTL